MTEEWKIKIQRELENRKVSGLKTPGIILLLEYKPENVWKTFYFRTLGYSQEQIARILGVSQRQISKYLSKNLWDVHDYLQRE